MSSIEDTQAAIDALDNPPEEPDEPEVEAGTDEPDAPEGEASEPILGKFKSQDDLVRAYQELERQFTQQRQAPEPEAEPQPEPYDPLANFAIGYDDADRQRIADSTIANPQKTLEWAMSADISDWQPNLKNEVYQLWHSFDPIAAQTFTARIAVAQEREEIQQMRSEWEQDQAQRQAEQNAEHAATAFATIQQRLPDFEQYRERVHQLFTAKPLADDDARLRDPESMFDFVKTLYARARFEEFEAQSQAAAAGQVPAKAGGKAKTQTRSTASPAAEAPADVQEFYDEVLAGQPDRD